MNRRMDDFTQWGCFVWLAAAKPCDYRWVVLYTGRQPAPGAGFRAAVGTPVYAAADGTVETAYRWNGRCTQGDTNSYGNMVKLRHADYRGGRLETLYAHLTTCVAQGETVKMRAS